MAKISVQDFFGLVLYNFDVEPFFQILKFEAGSSLLLGFLVSFSRKKKDGRAAIPLSSDKHNADNYIYRTYVNIQLTQRISLFATAHSNDSEGDSKD